MYDTLCVLGKALGVAERKVLASEIWQFLMLAVVFFVALLWLFVVYLPGRTLERWEDQRSGRGDGKIASPPGSGSSDGRSKLGS
jgi:type VI protein secretion system component VasK